DISLPMRFTKQVEILERQPDVVLVSGNLDLIDAHGNLLRQPRRVGDPGLIAWFLLFYNYLGGHGQVMFRRQTAIDIGGYSETRPCSQDYELWLRLAEVGSVVILPEVVLKMRLHDESISANSRLQQEAYSVVDSGRVLERMLEERLTLLDVIELRGFWLSRFPDSLRAAELNRKMTML